MGQSSKDRSGLSPALSMRRMWRSTITQYVLNQNYLVSLLAFCSGSYFLTTTVANHCCAFLFFFLHFNFVLWNFSKNTKNVEEYYYVHPHSYYLDSEIFCMSVYMLWGMYMHACVCMHVNIIYIWFIYFLTKTFENHRYYDISPIETVSCIF